MAMSVVYTNFNGMVVSEHRGGVDRDYMPDPLGSTAALLDDTQTITDTFEYWPYGEIAVRTGTNPTPFTWVGTLGYLQDIADKLFYVRARHYEPKYGRWLTVDPLWPDESAYGYGHDAPHNFVDPSGMLNIACIGCGICLGAALLAALVGCLGDPRGIAGCVLDWLEANPWALAVIAACLIICAACLGPAIARLIRGLIKPRPKPSPGGGGVELPRPQPGGGGSSGGVGRTGGSGRCGPRPRQNPGFPKGRWYQNCQAAYNACILTGGGIDYGRQCLNCRGRCRTGGGMKEWLSDDCRFWEDSWWRR